MEEQTKLADEVEYVRETSQEAARISMDAYMLAVSNRRLLVKWATIAVVCVVYIAAYGVLRFMAKKAEAMDGE